MIVDARSVGTRGDSSDARTGAQHLSLDAATQRSLRSLEPLRLCVDPDWEPYERVTADGHYAGIAADLFALVAERLGVRYEVVPTSDWEESLTLAERGACDVVPFLNQTARRRTFLGFTRPLLREPSVFITRLSHPWIEDASELGGAVVALPRGTRIEERLSADYPALRIHLVGSEAEALDAVRGGFATTTLRSLTVAAHAIRTSAAGDLRIAGQLPRYANHFRIGVVRSRPELLDLLDRAAATIDDSVANAVVARHVAVDHALLRDMAMLADQARRAGNHLRAVVDAIPNYVIALSGDGRTLVINAALCAALGIERPADAHGRDLVSLGVAAEHARALDTLRLEALATGVRVDSPAEPIQRPDGTPGVFDLSVTPYRIGEADTDAVLLVATDVTERVELERRIRQQAELDPLTRVLNRSAFGEHASVALSEARARRRHAAVALVDLDGFKAVNDRYGHAVGDLVLQRTATRMTGAVRTSDAVARLGGDEFAVLMSDVRSMEDAVGVAETVRRQIAEPILSDGVELKVGASVGVALFPSHGRDVAALLEAADAALYQVKASGRGAVRAAGVTASSV